MAGGPRPLIAGDGGDPMGTGDGACLPLFPACLIAECWLLCLRSLLRRPPPLPPLGFARELAREEGVVLEGRGRGSSVSDSPSSSLSVALASTEGVTERKVWALAGRGTGGGTAGGLCAEEAAEALGTGDARGNGATVAGGSAVTKPTADLLRGAAGAVAAAAEGTAATGAGAGAMFDSTDAFVAKCAPSETALLLFAGAACACGFGGATLALMSAAMDARRALDSSSLLSSSELDCISGCVSCCEPPSPPPSPPPWLLLSYRACNPDASVRMLIG